MNLRFESEWALWLLIPVALLLVLDIVRYRSRGGGVLFPSLHLLTGVRRSWRGRLRWLGIPTRFAIATLLVVALARPQLGEERYEVVTEGIDIVVVLDTSFSMVEEDFGGASRIDAAKRVARDFLVGLENHRTGMVLFSGEAVTLSPLTLDHQAVADLVQPVEAGVLPGGTAIGTGLATGINLLRDSEAESKVIILLTDGQNNSGEIGPYDAAQLARLLGIRLYTIGAAGGTTRGFPVDERQMRQISEMTGGSYFRASDESTLRSIYRDIEQLETTRVGSMTFMDYRDVAVWLMVPAALLVLLELVLGATLLRRVP